MIQHKFVAELYFNAEDVLDGLQKLSDHFAKLAKGETSYILQEGSSSAGPGDPNLDTSIETLGIVDYTLLPNVQRLELAEVALKAIVEDARDEGRADMRDSVDEQLIEEARLILRGQTPKRYLTVPDQGGSDE